MATEDFIYREVVITEDLLDDPSVEVSSTTPLCISRMRNSKGAFGIKITFNGESLTFKKPNYEQHVRQVIARLQEIVDNPCYLPEVRK